VHVGPIPGFEIEGLTSDQTEPRLCIDAEGNEQEEAVALSGFLALSPISIWRRRDRRHNMHCFTYIYLSALSIKQHPGAAADSSGEYNRARRVRYDEGMVALASHRVGLDDLAWALRNESSKNGRSRGQQVFDLYQAGRLAEIREYNLNDVRVTRKVYERLIACFGRDESADYTDFTDLGKQFERVEPVRRLLSV